MQSERSPNLATVVFASVAMMCATTVNGDGEPGSNAIRSARKHDVRREALQRLDEHAYIKANRDDVVTYLELHELPEEVLQLLEHIPDVQ